MGFKNFIRTWKTLLKNRDYIISLLTGLLIVAVSYIFYIYVIGYVDGLKGLPALRDLIHSFLPVWDLSFLYIYGMMAIFGVLLLYFLFFRPDLFPFYLKVFGLVYITRSVFICLTHLGPPEGFMIPIFASEYKMWLIKDLLHTNDLFFSGHVAYPFMGALLVRKLNGFLFYLFLFFSAVMAVTVLSMRIHYSIDVASAFFIVYGIYSFAVYVFGKKDFSFHTPEKRG
jgi:membrane-associated phospholipid phosphatase